ncbi:MAG: ATP-binding protein [Hyphomicrobium sp.]|nr:ATP-binding protein [Hyphomicrobium sp.]
MTFVRSLLFNRIGGQMAILIVLSLFAIHAIITAGFFLSQRNGDWGPPDDGPAQFVSAIKLIAAAAPGERTRLVAQVAKAFPHMQVTPVSSMPGPSDPALAEPRLRFLAHSLGPEFQLAALPAATAQAGAAPGLGVAVRMPDGGVVTARLPPRYEPPMLGGPIAITVLFVVVTLTLLGLWATRALRRPLSGFAAAAEGFNLDGTIAALPERGPEEVRAVAKAFNRMRDRIRRLVDDRTRLLAAMGHDLRTPITRLRLRSEFIADDELRGQMLRDLDQMRRMTEGVLSFLRDGQARAGATFVDVATSLQTICDQFADMGCRVAYIGPDHLAIMASADELFRAVTNVVDNAVRYGNETVIRLAATADAITIDVEDDGPGILDTDKLAMIEPFVRGDEARVMNQATGFGLGLSIAKAVAEAHGGTLTLHDRVPQGLIARMTLPGWAAIHRRALT